MKNDREDILFELDGNNNIITEYLHGSGIDEPIAMIRGGQTYYYHADGLGSIIAITNSAGQVVQKYEYNSFGEITYQQDVNFKQPYTYTGREYDNESGLYYYRARYYDSKIGRFLQQDPFRGFLRYPQTQNRYPYTLNNPVNMTDATGEGPIAIGACIGFAAYDAISTAVTLNRLTNEVLEIQKKIKELTDSCKSTEDYLKVHEEVEKLQKQALEKIEEKTRALAKGSLYGIPIGVFCAAAPVLPF